MAVPLGEWCLMFQGHAVVCKGWNVYGHFDPWWWDHYAVSTHWAPITQSCGTTSQKKDNSDCTSAKA